MLDNMCFAFVLDSATMKRTRPALPQREADLLLSLYELVLHSKCACKLHSQIRRVLAYALLITFYCSACSPHTRILIYRSIVFTRGYENEICSFCPFCTLCSSKCSTRICSMLCTIHVRICNTVLFSNSRLSLVGLHSLRGSCRPYVSRVAPAL